MITVRLDCPWGRHRFSLPSGATLGELRAQVESRTGVAEAQQVLSLDRAGTDVLPSGGHASLQECQVRSGDWVFLRVGEKRPAPRAEAAAPARNMFAEDPVPAKPSRKRALERAHNIEGAIKRASAQSEGSTATSSKDGGILMEDS